MSLDDRLSFGESPLGGEAPQLEPEEPRGRRSRAFLFLAIAMGGLILLGILALVAAVMFVVPRQREQRAASITQTISAATQQAAAWTPTFTSVPIQEPTLTEALPPTWTPEPTATATRVVGGGEAATRPAAGATATRSRDVGGGTTPAAGLGGFGAVSIAVGLSGLMFAVRKLRLRR
ncbi:MAG: hypothetical protein ISS56_10205 [Anaerolineae bacterium]|jgi:hypothetical protein|nr:hypothetical protein [Anaerolineae bacterium]